MPPPRNVSVLVHKIDVFRSAVYEAVSAEYKGSREGSKLPITYILIDMRMRPADSQ